MRFVEYLKMVFSVFLIANDRFANALSFVIEANDDSFKSTRFLRVRVRKHLLCACIMSQEICSKTFRSRYPLLLSISILCYGNDLYHMFIYTQTEFTCIVMWYFLQNTIILPNTKGSVKQKVLYINWLFLMSIC